MKSPKSLGISLRHSSSVLVWCQHSREHLFLSRLHLSKTQAPRHNERHTTKQAAVAELAWGASCSKHPCESAYHTDAVWGGGLLCRTLSLTDADVVTPIPFWACAHTGKLLIVSRLIYEKRQEGTDCEDELNISCWWHLIKYLDTRMFHVDTHTTIELINTVY